MDVFLLKSEKPGEPWKTWFDLYLSCGKLLAAKTFSVTVWTFRDNELEKPGKRKHSRLCQTAQKKSAPLLLSLSCKENLTQAFPNAMLLLVIPSAM